MPAAADAAAVHAPHRPRGAGRRQGAAVGPRRSAPRPAGRGSRRPGPLRAGHPPRPRRLPTGQTIAAWDEQLSSIPRPTQAALRTLEWIGRHENLVVGGPSGTGKTFLLEALGQAARTWTRPAQCSRSAATSASGSWRLRPSARPAGPRRRPGWWPGPARHARGVAPRAGWRSRPPTGSAGAGTAPGAATTPAVRHDHRPAPGSAHACRGARPVPARPSPGGSGQTFSGG
jgi:IstB-like ATP binding protein